MAWSTFFGGNATGLLTDSLQVAGAALDADLGRTRFLLKAVANGVDAAKMALKSASTRLVVGPAGAGEHLRQQATPLVDGLVHGERRWFTMAPDAFGKLRSKAEAAALHGWLQISRSEIKALCCKEKICCLSCKSF